ncbi:Hypothetical predicted protein [Olea europaea subsp. europaea]|uniref:DUF1985 domain-containing protein n=1 Tax=Olea europaea subsp. europaea TaxID=158383 RepID=A0A8S0RZQ6_OLEEU|nr:Hypothetical predicted protein [Olea europaea subsp. europaea]
MEFQFGVFENVRLPVRISQRSNLKYIKTVMDNLDDRLRADFRNSCLGILADVPEIQFSTQLIQALVCQGIRCDKSHELRFNVQGHLTWFGLQKYAIVTGLHAGSFPEGDRYTKALEKRRLKEKYFKSLEKISCAQMENTFVRASTPGTDRCKLGLALIVEGVITASDNNVGIDEDTHYLVDDLELFFHTTGPKPCLHNLWMDINATIFLFSSGLIWAYEVVPELSERFDGQVGERSPRLLYWTSTKQPQQRMYDAFFRDVQLHVHATLRPTEAERDLPYIVSLVPFPDRSVQFLDDLARSVVGPQFHEAARPVGDMRVALRVTGMTTSLVQGSRTMRHRRAMIIRHRRATRTMGLRLMTVETEVATSPGMRGGPTVMRDDVEGMLLDQRILFEMRLRIVKLKIIQHMIEEFARLRDFISNLVSPSGGTSTSATAPVMNVPNI